jgi:hypothetical protein
VLQSESLSGAVHHWFKRKSTRENLWKEIIIIIIIIWVPRSSCTRIKGKSQRNIVHVDFRLERSCLYVGESVIFIICVNEKRALMLDLIKLSTFMATCWTSSALYFILLDGLIPYWMEF